ncbi:MAG: hypothetical protein HQ553_17225 [Chloroflexi bacterium]|nr:hypothetical protein [Chloroflexota bacterium]
MRLLSKMGTAVVLILFLAISLLVACGSDDETKEPAPTHAITPAPTTTPPPALSPTPTSSPSPMASVKTFDEGLWRNPSLEYHPYARWWWPGGAVESDEIERELSVMRDAGFGGVELAEVVFGLALDEVENNPEIRTVGTPEFFQKVLVAAKSARNLGMGFDVTLGSGWPGGVPNASAAPERQLLMSSLQIEGPVLYDGTVPPPEIPYSVQFVIDINMDTVLGPFDTDTEVVAVTAARVIDDSTAIQVLESFVDITDKLEGEILRWQVPEGKWLIFAFHQNRTNHCPAGSAYPDACEVPQVVDHLDPAGARELINAFGDPLLDALGDQSPDAIFVDGFEMVAELPWTPSFLEAFQTSKGYDLVPYLPLTFLQRGESKYNTITVDMYGRTLDPVYTANEIGSRVREDYEDVRAQLFMDGFVVPVRDWAHSNDLLLRLQSQGGLADFIDVYEMVDIPETEGLYSGGRFDFLKLASSAAHTSGKPLVGSESFIVMAANGHALTLEDFYRLGGRLLSAGVNRIVYHGWPYHYIQQDGEPWYQCIADPEKLCLGNMPMTSWIDESHPVWEDFPAFNDYLARLCYAMSTGTHRADVAWLLPDWRVPDEVFANFGGIKPEEGESEVSKSLKRAGLVYDRVSQKGLTDATVIDGGFQVGQGQYKALLLTEFDVASPELMESIKRVSAAGIPIVVVGELPTRARGLVDYEKRDMETQQSSDRLRTEVVFVTEEADVGASLISLGVQPLLTPMDSEDFKFALDHRELADSDIVLLFNEFGEDRAQTLAINLAATGVQMLNPETGESAALHTTLDADGQSIINVTIPARRSVVLWIER